MQLKDYYTILELPPSASPDEIKKAYRRLAHQYHPDKNANDPYASAKFAEIKEAYETLTNPAKKDFYLQQRWYTQSMGKRTTSVLVTPVIILKQLLELDRYSSKLDIHRMDKEGLYQYISYVLSDDNINKLNEFREADTNKEIIFAALKTASLLPYPFMRDLGIRLQKIQLIEEAAIRQIDQLVHESRQAEYWEKRRVVIVIIIVVVLCVSIFITAKS